MRRPSRVFVSLLFVGCAILADSAFAQRPRPKNRIVGGIWSYRGTEVADDKPTGKKIEGRFRVADLEVFHGPKKVGVAEPDPEDKFKTTIRITDWPEMNGVMKLKKVGLRPPIGQGIFMKDDGTRWRMTVKGIAR